MRREKEGDRRGWAVLKKVLGERVCGGGRSRGSKECRPRKLVLYQEEILCDACWQRGATSDSPNDQRT